VEGNASNLAELIPHHNHSSLDGLNPVDVMRPTNDKCALYAELFSSHCADVNTCCCHSVST
jgi:hypothetical protein